MMYFNIKLIKIKITIKLFYCGYIIILTFRKHYIMNYNIYLLKVILKWKLQHNTQTQFIAKLLP